MRYITCLAISEKYDNFFYFSLRKAFPVLTNIFIKLPEPGVLIPWSIEALSLEVNGTAAII
jgi:hypothetical protein